MIKRFASLIDPKIAGRSGKVFYSGRSAFGKKSDLYLIGFNPGGDPAKNRKETINSHTADVLNKFLPRWSAYIDESWRCKPPGTHGIQPRVLHMLHKLGRCARTTPSSNLIFVRSKSQADLKKKWRKLADRCWPFHQEVIRVLRPRVIVCFGQRAGKSVRDRLSANRHVGQFKEDNDRGWKSHAHVNDEGIAVVTVTHPSRADWTKKATDPTPLVRKMLKRR